MNKEEFIQKIGDIEWEDFEVKEAKSEVPKNSWESVQAQMKVTVKRILRKYGYPPDKQQKATETVLEQAKLLCKDLTD